MARGLVNGKRFAGRPLCPVDPRHGYLITWEGRWAYFCPSQQHDGSKDIPPTRSLFTDEDIREAEENR